MKRALKWIGGIFLGLILLIAVALTVALSSPAVARWAVRTGLKRAPSGISIGSVSGRLRGPLLLTNISYRTQAMQAHIDSVLIDWRLSHLLMRQLQLDKLHVIGTRVTLADSMPKDTTKKRNQRSRPHLPVDVHFGDVSIRDVAVHAPGDMSLRIDTVQVAGSSAGGYRFASWAVVTAPHVDRAQLWMRGHGTLEKATLDSASTGIMGGRITTQGDLSWWPAIGWDLVMHAVEVRPATMMPDTTTWPGSISLRLATKGTIDSTGPDVTIALDSLSGTLRKQPLSGLLRARARARQYRIDTLALALGGTRAHLAGDVGDTLALRYSLTSDNLQTLAPSVRGALEVHGDASGAQRTPHLRADGQLHRFASGTNSMARVTLAVNANLARGGVLDVKLAADSGVVSGQALHHADLSVRGTRERHVIGATAMAARGQLRLTADGGYDGKAWSGHLDTLSVDSTTAGAWHLQRRTTLVVSSPVIRVDSLCVMPADSLHRADSAGTSLCVTGQKQADAWRADIDATRLPLSWFAAANGEDSLVGTVTAQARATGAGNRVSGTVKIDAHDGALVYHQPGQKQSRRLVLDSAAINGEVGNSGTHVTLGMRISDGDKHALVTVAGSATLPSMRSLSGDMSHQALDVRVDGESPDLRFLAPFTGGSVDSINGSASLHLTANGTVGTPHLDGSFQLDKLLAALPGQRDVRGALRLAVNGTMQRRSGFDGTLQLTPTDLRYDYREFAKPHWFAISGQGVSFKGGGTGHGVIDLIVISDAGVRVASVNGTLDLPDFGGDLPFARQRMNAHIEQRVDDLSIMQVFTAQVDSLKGRFDLTADVSGRAAAPTLALKAVVDSLHAHFPFGSTLRGGITSEVHVAVAADSSFTAQADLAPVAMTVEYRESGAVRTLSLDSTALHLTGGNDGIKGALTLAFASANAGNGVTVGAGTSPVGANGQFGVIRGTIELPQYTRFGRPTAKQPLSVTLAGSIDDLSFVRAFTPLIDSAAGTVKLDSKVTGTVADSRMMGSLAIHHTALRLPRLGILLDSVELDAHGDQAGAVSVNASMHSGHGALSIAGTSPVKPTAAAPGHVHIEGNNFEAANSAQLRAVVSPNIDVSVADVMQVRGAVQVPYARLVLTDIPQTAIAPSDDVVLIDSVSAKPKGPRIDTNVQITLGDSVSFSGFNFNADMSGAIRVAQQPDQLPTASGTIVIDSGTYKAYGQDLTIQNGKVQFAGGRIDNPGLDIRASRTADSVTAGLDIKGTLKRPEVTIFSEPPMSQTQALSYIVTGHGVGQGTGSSGNLVSKALSALGLRGGNAIAGSLGHELHLDEARIQTEGDIKKASFVAGTYLSPNVYISYGIGLFDPVSTLRLRYMVSGHFTLQAEAGKTTGGDVLIKTTN